MSAAPPNSDEYVHEHTDTLVESIKHGNDDFVRALALAALVKFGGEPGLAALRDSALGPFGDDRDAHKGVTL